MAQHNSTNNQQTSERGLTRRGFLTGALGVGVGAAGFGMLAGCSSAASSDSAADGTGADTSDAPQTEGGLGAASQTVEADVIVVGAGAAGMMAALEAGKAGSKVVVISNSPNAVATNGSMVSGTCAVETKYVEEMGETITTGELFNYMAEFIHGMPNLRLLRSCVDLMPSNIEIFEDMGIAMMAGVDRYDIGIVDVHLFGTENKGQVMQDYITDKYDVEFVYETEAQEPIMENGVFAGVKAKQGDTVIDYKGKSTVLACGGFLFDEEQMGQSFGNQIAKLSSPYQTGYGIRIAKAAGAYRESIDTMGLSDIVGGNIKNEDWFNPACMPALYGGVLVNPQGNRFMNEYNLAMASMSYGGEPLLHVPEYYAIFDEAGFKANTEEGGYYGYMGNPECWMSGLLLYSNPIEGFDELVSNAESDGWAWTFDSVADAAKELNLTNLEQTITDYNGFCETGNDTEFFKRAEMLKALDTDGPIHVFQYNAAAFNTAGGCRTDEFCRALKEDFSVVDGLYIAGVENGSLYGRPYYVVGGTMSGLSYSSGRLAGMQAAEYAGK